MPDSKTCDGETMALFLEFYLVFVPSNTFGVI
jgi:hypothetical protein